MKKIIFCSLLVSILFSSLTIINCDKKSEEDIIFETLKEITGYVDKNDLDSFSCHITLDYSDPQNRTYEDLVNIIGNYMAKYDGIVVHILKGEFTSKEISEYHLQVDIGISSGYAKALRKVIPFTGYLIKLSLKMVKNDGIWQIKEALWRMISKNELFSGSLNILKKLFPNI